VVDPNSPSHQLVGAVLNGRWKLVRLLGEGGMGAVFEADSLRGEGKRAIKLLHPEFTREEPVLQRFFAEAQTSQSLNHPNIARVFESARAEDGTPYLVMELLQGTPLSAWIDAGTPIPPQQAGPIVYGILQALHVAHQQRVVHRDIKPDNLFMTRDAAGQYVIKVLDFGIAKVMDAAGGMGNKTRTGVLLGTPGYMSPEQIKNSKAVDARSDLWAVATIFYEMLTLRLPFVADNEFARLTAVLTDEVTPIEQVLPQLASWSGYFRRALAKDPAERFQSAEEMANALMVVSRGGTLSGAAPGPAPGPANGSATIAMSAMPEAYPAPPQTGPAHSARLGTSTVPSSPSPATFQGAQQAQPAPGTLPGAQQQPMATPAPRQAYGTIQSAAHGGMAPQPIAMAAPPIIMGPPPLMAPMAGDNTGRGQSPTHVSAQRPPGMLVPSVPPPNIQIIEAPPLQKMVALWIVGAVGAGCLLIGFLIGFVVGR
jgi:serine/threonine protein kinase